MNYKKLGKILGKIMILEGILMLAPLAVSLIYKERLLNVFAFAIPIAALKPMRAISSRPRKLIRATPNTSIITPPKYLERRCPMSEIAFAVSSSYLSGTSARTMLVNMLSSFMKKKLMNDTEKSPTTKLVRADAAEPIIEENAEGSSIF